MKELRPVGDERVADEECHTRIAAHAVPVRPVAFRGQQQCRYLLGRRLHFLEADDVGLLFGQECMHLLGTSPDAVDVPGDDFHGATALPGPTSARRPVTSRPIPSTTVAASSAPSDTRSPHPGTPNATPGITATL